MSHHVEKSKLVMIEVPNKLGAGANVFCPIAEAGANLTTVCAWGNGKKAGMLFDADDIALAKKALRKAKIKFVNTSALKVTLKDKPGAFADICAKMADAKINLDMAYATPGKKGSTVIYLSTEKDAKAYKIIEGM